MGKTSNRTNNLTNFRNYGVPAVVEPVGVGAMACPAILRLLDSEKAERWEKRRSSPGNAKSPSKNVVKK